MIICNTCGGQYEPIQDNEVYYHVCPEFKTDLIGNKVPILNRRNENITYDKDADGKITPGTIRIKAGGLGAQDSKTGQPYIITVNQQIQIVDSI